MQTITFIFDVNQKVKTPLGEDAIIDTCSFVGNKNRYYVIMKEGRGAWFDEDLLTAVE